MSSKSTTASLHVQDQDCNRHYTYHLDGSMSSVVQSIKTLREDFGHDINKVIDQSTSVAHQDDEQEEDDDDSSDAEPDSKKLKSG